MDEKYWGEKSVVLFKLWLGNAWNKGGLLLLAGGVSILAGWFDKLVRFVAFSIWPNTPQTAWQDSPEYIGWILVTLGIALLGIGSIKTKPPNPNDIALHQKLQKIFTVGQLDFLETHDFHNNWHSSYINDIEDIADDWNNAQHEFVDRKLNKLLRRVKELSREFARIENYGFNVYPGQLVRTFRTAGDQSDHFTQQTRARIAEANRAAKQLSAAANELERAARRRLPTA